MRYNTSSLQHEATCVLLGNTGTYIAHTKRFPTFSFPNIRIFFKKIFKVEQGRKENETRKKNRIVHERGRS